MVRVNDTVVGIYSNINQHLNKWENSPFSHSAFHCMVFYSNNRNWGWQFLPIHREWQSEPALGSCRQLSLLYRLHDTREDSKRPRSKPVCCCCCCQTSAWKVTAQCPAAATHILCVHRGAWGSLCAAKWVWEEGKEWHHCQTASHRRGWLQSRGSFLHIHHIHTQTFEPNCFLTALLCSRHKIHGLGKHPSLCRTSLFLQCYLIQFLLMGSLMKAQGLGTQNKRESWAESCNQQVVGFCCLFNKEKKGNLNTK